MKKMFRRLIFLSLFFAWVLSGAALAQNRVPTWGVDLFPQDPLETRYAKDRVIVKFKSPVRSDYRNGQTRQRIDAQLDQAGVRMLQDHPHVGLATLQVTGTGVSIKQVLQNLRNSGLVEYAEPDYIVHVDAAPNDPRYSELWGLNNTGQTGGTTDADIDALEAWGVNTGSASQVVVVIDSGVDYTHPDLAANMWRNPAEASGQAGVDDDNNGFVDDIYGIDTVNNDSDPMDDNNHGTHVSGTIGAVGNNAVGVVGVNWNIQIMACKFLSATGSGATSGAISCLDYVVMMKNKGVNIKLSNNSWGGTGFSQALKDAIVTQANAGILFVAAAGNDGTDNDATPHYPSSYNLDGILSVASTDANDARSSFSNFGATSVDLGAPGSGILSTVPNNGYSVFNGTSMATPQVSGAAALVWAQNPGFTATQIKSLLMNKGDPIAALAGITVSGKRLNVNNAISCTPGTPSLSVVSPGSGFSATLGQNIPVAVSISDCSTAVTAATVTVTPTNGDPVFSLLDNGAAPDQTANDGVYSGTWVPGNSGAVTLNVSATAGASNLTGSVAGSVIQNYTAGPTAFAAIDATTGANIGLDGDDVSTSVPIGFTFTYYGNAFTNVRVASNGYLTFGTSGGEWSNASIPTAAVPNDLVAPFWDDLQVFSSNGSAVYSLLQGTAPNRTLTIEWVDATHFSGTSTQKITFEATLFEGSNDIKFQYLDAVFGNTGIDNGASATAGVENSDGTLGSQFSFNQASLTDSSAVLFSLSSAVPPGQLAVTPASGFSSSGPQGGTFAPASKPYTLTNSGGQSITYTVSKNALWLDVSTPGGTLAAGATATLTVSLNANAGTQAAGNYTDTVTITDTTNTATVTRSVTLSVQPAGSSQLTVDPPTGLTSSGAAGGPFTPASKTFTLTNIGTQSLTFAITNTVGWVTLSAAQGTVSPGTPVTVDVSINVLANTLPPGTNIDTITFTDQTNNLSVSRPVSLTVQTSGTAGTMSVSPVAGLVASGPSGGPFSPGTKTFTVANTGGARIDYSLTAADNWLAFSGNGGSLQGGENTTITVSINNNGSSLSPGRHTSSITFTNLTNGQGSVSRPVELMVAPLHRLTIDTPPNGNFNPVDSGRDVVMAMGVRDTWDHPLGFAWSASCANMTDNGAFSDPALAHPTWTAPVVEPGETADCTIAVTVTDGHGLSESASYLQKVNELAGRRVFSPYWQSDVGGVYTFVGIAHPGLRRMSSQIGVVFQAVEKGGGVYGPAMEFTITAKQTQKVFIVETNHPFVNPTTIPEAIFVTNNRNGFGFLEITPVASNPDVIPSTPGGGSQDLTNLIFWGAVVVQANTTGFAMEFVAE